MTSPPSPVDWSNLCSHEASNCTFLPSRRSLLPPCDGFFVSPLFLVSRRLLVSLSFTLSSKTTVSWLASDEMFAPEWATYRRCFPAQPMLSALQRYNRRKCAHLLRDLAVTVDLQPPRCILLPPASGPGSQVVRKGRQRPPHVRRPPSGSCSLHPG